MSFSDSLRMLVDEVGCSGRELAEASGLADSTVSRYLSGNRVPRHAEETTRKLAFGLGKVADKRGVDGFDVQTAQALLECELSAQHETVDFAKRFGAVIETFGITNNRLARYMGFDPSYISRIIAGTRTPADISSFIDKVSSYVARNRFDGLSVARAAELTGREAEQLSNPQELATAIERFLGSDVFDFRQQDAIDRFVEKLDEFDLNDFLRNVAIDAPAPPADGAARLPMTKTYRGVEQMKQAEIDFLLAASQSPTGGDVYLYSDMPLAEMAEDKDFLDGIMRGFSALVRSDAHLHVIHDVHRPFAELLMGLEGWIPLYMTGKISPYYLPNQANTAFLHFLRAADDAAITGEAVAGRQEHGRYLFSRKAEDVAYVQQRCKDLLALARPLMRIYRADQEAELERAVGKLAERKTRGKLGSHGTGDKRERGAKEIVNVGEGTFKNIRISVLPDSYALVQKHNTPQLSFLIEYPALVDALERFEPLLR